MTSRLPLCYGDFAESHIKGDEKPWIELWPIDVLKKTSIGFAMTPKKQNLYKGLGAMARYDSVLITLLLKVENLEQEIGALGVVADTFGAFLRFNHFNKTIDKTFLCRRLGN